MKILVTGYKGFIGKNLVAQLRNEGYDDLLLYDVDTEESELDGFLERCDFVFHLAGVNRPQNDDEFEKGNNQLTCHIIGRLKHFGNNCPIVASSSVQAENDSPYGKSKRAMETALFEYSRETGAPVYVYRLPNVYGKWCKPNYNSVVATFCHNVARDIDIRIDNSETVLRLVYVDDVVNAFIGCIEKGFCEVSTVDTVSLGQLAEKIRAFRENRRTLVIPSFEGGFDRKLYATYVSYLPEDNFSYALEKKSDARGFFCECIKNNMFGQVSVSVTKPGIVRGDHWHNTKVEKFLVVAGSAVVRFRLIGTEDITEYYVSGDEPEVIDVPVGYTHSIENVGDNDMVAFIWCDELFEPERPDTYFQKVR